MRLTNPSGRSDSERSLHGRRPEKDERNCDDTETELISPDWFRRYAVPALTEYARICHRAGKLFIIHMCGPIRDLLPDIAATGADAVHCLTLPPLGNTTINQARRVLAGRMAVMLRIDADLMLRGSAPRIDRAVADIRDALDGWKNALIIVPCGRAPLDALRRVVAQVHRQPGG